MYYPIRNVFKTFKNVCKGTRPVPYCFVTECFDITSQSGPVFSCGSRHQSGPVLSCARRRRERKIRDVRNGTRPIPYLELPGVHDPQVHVR